MTKNEIITISIIIPIYNSSNYIGLCIDSIFSQECEEAVIECILVNDYTPDNSMEIIHNKLNDYKGRIHFKIINFDTNRGHCAARNAGIRISTGDYILFVDSDDTLTPGTIHYFIEGIKNHGWHNVDVVMGNTFNNADKIEIMHLDYDTPFLINNSDETALRKLLSRELFHTSWNKLVKRSFFTEHQLYFQEGIINEDLLWSYLLFHKMKNILVMPRVTYTYINDNPLNISNTSQKRIRAIIESRILICNTIIDTPPRLKKSFIDYYAYILFILVRVINLYEDYIKGASGLHDDLFSLRNRFLKSIWKGKCYLLLLYSLLYVAKPFYYITRLWIFRRYYDRITKIIVHLQKALISSINE